MRKEGSMVRIRKRNARRSEWGACGRAMARSFTGAMALLSLLIAAQTASADVYKFVGKSGSSYYATKSTPGKSSGIPPRPRDVLFVGTLGISPGMGSAGYFSHQTSEEINQWVDLAASNYGLDPKLLHAVIATESAYKPDAVSPKGAAGMMQLMPATAARFNVDDRFDPRESILGGSRYLSSLLGMFDQDLELALAAYNAGEGNVMRYGRKIPPFNETQNYVAKVLRNYRR